MNAHQILTLDGHEYVVIPRKQYDRLVARAATPNAAPKAAVDAIEFARQRIGENLRAARNEGGLTQTELANRLGKSQSLVAGIEAGRVKAGEAYVIAVLAACGLPKNWKAKRPRK